MDDGTLNSRWNFIPNTPFSDNGIIQSTEDSCLCMRSTDTHDGTAITLAVCDRNDNNQRWQEWSNNNGFFNFYNIGSSGDQVCVAEDSHGTLIQRNCNTNAQEQLWHTFDVTTQTLDPPF